MKLAFLLKLHRPTLKMPLRMAKFEIDAFTGF